MGALVGTMQAYLGRNRIGGAYDYAFNCYRTLRAFELQMPMLVINRQVYLLSAVIK